MVVVERIVSFQFLKLHKYLIFASSQHGNMNVAIMKQVRMIRFVQYYKQCMFNHGRLEAYWLLFNFNTVSKQTIYHMGRICLLLLNENLWSLCNGE